MAVAEQLCLIDFLEQESSRLSAPSIVDVLLHNHHGDYRQVIEELLLDADFLRDQLYTASQLMSSGYSRGWKPKYERV
jgi:hypothetical protein